MNKTINVCFVQSSVKHSAPTASVEMKSDLCATRLQIKVEYWLMSGRHANQNHG